MAHHLRYEKLEKIKTSINKQKRKQDMSPCMVVLHSKMRKREQIGISRTARDAPDLCLNRCSESARKLEGIEFNLHTLLE